MRHQSCTATQRPHRRPCSTQPRPALVQAANTAGKAPLVRHSPGQHWYKHTTRAVCARAALSKAPLSPASWPRLSPSLRLVRTFSLLTQLPMTPPRPRSTEEHPPGSSLAHAQSRAAHPSLIRVSPSLRLIPRNAPQTNTNARMAASIRQALSADRIRVEPRHLSRRHPSQRDQTVTYPSELSESSGPHMRAGPHRACSLPAGCTGALPASPSPTSGAAAAQSVSSIRLVHDSCHMYCRPRFQTAAYSSAGPALCPAGPAFKDRSSSSRGSCFLPPTGAGKQARTSSPVRPGPAVCSILARRSREPCRQADPPHFGWRKGRSLHQHRIRPTARPCSFPAASGPARAPCTPASRPSTPETPPAPVPHTIKRVPQQHISQNTQLSLRVAPPPPPPPPRLGRTARDTTAASRGRQHGLRSGHAP